MFFILLFLNKFVLYLSITLKIVSRKHAKTYFVFTFLPLFWIFYFRLTSESGSDKTADGYKDMSSFSFSSQNNLILKGVF